jgi:hypothetical protein
MKSVYTLSFKFIVSSMDNGAVSPDEEITIPSRKITLVESIDDIEIGQGIVDDLLPFKIDTSSSRFLYLPPQPPQLTAPPPISPPEMYDCTVMLNRTVCAPYPTDRVHKDKALIVWERVE